MWTELSLKCFGNVPLNVMYPFGGTILHVSYWEDGLAIYADGSREERRPEADVDTKGDGFWEERIKGHSDSKPHGPSSVGVDVVFHGDTNLRKVYGLPEHTSRLALPHTTGPRTHYTDVRFVETMYGR